MEVNTALSKVLQYELGLVSLVERMETPNKIKTQLCQKHSNPNLYPNGCPYGRKCHFAHGKFELRPKIDRHWFLQDSLYEIEMPFHDTTCVAISAGGAQKSRNVRFAKVAETRVLRPN